jgi:signal transduction histidine kinase
MSIYSFLSKIVFARKKYGFKFFLIALPSMLLPLAVVTIFMMVNGEALRHTGLIVAIAILLSIICGWGMYYLFDKMVEPLRLAKEGLNAYIDKHEIPHLPLHFDDEAGQLLSDIQTTIARLDTLITEKSDMIDLLSHDLRSPVGRIQSLSGLIKVDGEDQKDLYADYIINECKGLLRVLENILLMLKEDSHAFRLVSVNLKQLIEETVGFYDFAIAEKGLTIEIAVDEWQYILVQQDLFTQAVRNIVGNAIKFSSDGKKYQ